MLLNNNSHDEIEYVHQRLAISEKQKLYHAFICIVHAKSNMLDSRRHTLLFLSLGGMVIFQLTIQPTVIIVLKQTFTK